MLDLKEYGIVMWPEEKVISFREKLLAWYDENKRDLPWRRSKILITSGYLKSCFSRPGWIQLSLTTKDFLDWFPTVESLATAPEESLLKAWEGLGYYSRVRNMQAAAQQIMTDFGGQFPNTYEGISSLKGIDLTQQEPFPVLLLTCLSQL